MAYEYIKQAYGVKPEPGMRVTIAYNKHVGTIARKRHYTHYVFVKLDGHKHARPYHPLDLIYPLVPNPTESGE